MTHERARCRRGVAQAAGVDRFGTKGDPIKMVKWFVLAAAAAFGPGAWAGPAISFFMNGDTYASGFTLTNVSTAESVSGTPDRVVKFHLDVGPAQLVFDTNINFVPNCPNASDGSSLAARAGAAETGWVPTVGPSDCTTTLNLGFNDFDAGETFTWVVDLDGAVGDVRTVVGSMLIGATAWVEFSDGTRQYGVMSDPPSSVSCATYVEPLTGQSYARPCSTFVVTRTDDGRTVPEPESFALVGLGVVVLAAARRTRALDGA